MARRAKGDQEASSTTTSASVVQLEYSEVEHAVLTERFNVWSIIGMNFSLTATPLAIGSYLVFTVGVGGSPFFIYGYIFAVLMQLAVCLSLAEIAAALPHVSGTPDCSSISSLSCTNYF